MGHSKICGCNVFSLAIGLIITEIVLILLGVIYPLSLGTSKAGYVFFSLVYLSVELYGIVKKNEALIIFGIVIRVLVTVTIFCAYIALFVIPICGTGDQGLFELDDCKAEASKDNISLEDYEFYIRCLRTRVISLSFSFFLYIQSRYWHRFSYSIG